MLAATFSLHVRPELRNRRFFANRVPHRNCRPSGWKEPLRMTGIDWLILGLYFAFVLGIGVALKGSMKTSTDFFLAGRAIPAWVCGHPTAGEKKIRAGLRSEEHTSELQSRQYLVFRPLLGKKTIY